jgi:hypothetical protein
LIGHWANIGNDSDPDAVGHMKKMFMHKHSHGWGTSNTQLAHAGGSVEIEWESSAVVAKETQKAKFEAWWEGSWTKSNMDNTEETVSLPESAVRHLHLTHRE